MRRKMRRIGSSSENDDPLQGVANLFDLGIVFALGFLLTLITYLGLPVLQQKDKKAPTKSGEPVPEEKYKEVEKYKVSDTSLGGEGEKLGIAYRLKSGEVVFIPEKKEEQKKPNPKTK